MLNTLLHIITYLVGYIITQIFNYTNTNTKEVFYMSLLNKYNKKAVFEYDKEVERDYTSLADLVELNGIEKQYIVEALFINTKSKFGEAPVIVSGEWLVNAPKHLTNIVKEMQNDDAVVELVNKRLVTFKIYSYQDNNGIKRYSVEWLELK